MSNFEVLIKRIEHVEHHPNADRLDLVGIGGYQCVVGRSQHQVGEWVAYIPEAAVLPTWLIQAMDLEGRLAGKQQNRVKAVRLRQQLSQGLVYPVLHDVGPEDQSYIKTDSGIHFVSLGMNVTEELGIVKWDPPVPVHMSGEVTNIHGKTIHYDIENVKMWPDVFVEGEEVVITEKLHGTFLMLGYYPGLNHPELINGNTIIASKGLGGQGLVFKNNERNKDNVYVRAYESTRDQGGITILPELIGRSTSVIERVIYCTELNLFSYLGTGTPFYILGEIFGRGIQDLTYGTTKPELRVFDVYVGQPGYLQGRFLNFNEKVDFCASVNIKLVPVLYRGLFTKAKMEELTNGKETVSGKALNVREGVVITPVLERYVENLGRVILKSVGEDYLLRRGNNLTEFE